MKTIIFALFLSIFSVKTQAQSVVGKWELQSFVYSITKQDGTTKATTNNIREKGVIITWEFLANGKFIGKQDGNMQEGTWKLKGNQLIISGDFSKELAESLGMSELVYEMTMVGNKMNLSVDATKMGNYKKNILTYTYLKL